MTGLRTTEAAVVVAGAIIRGGRVLAARRTHPPALAGGWELPGGKVQPGESEPGALRRELAEELAVVVTVGGRIGPDVDLGDNRVLRCFQVALVRGRPTSSEHDALCWVGAEELTSLCWLPADARLITELRGVLDGSWQA